MLIPTICCTTFRWRHASATACMCLYCRLLRCSQKQSLEVLFSGLCRQLTKLYYLMDGDAPDAEPVGICPPLQTLDVSFQS